MIIPCYNRADLLRITLRNVLGQSLRPAQILVVDDHSTDHISQTAHEFDGVVQFVLNQPGAARNLGMQLTTAPLVQFFDSDDLMAGPKLEMQANALLNQQADIAYGPYVMAEEATDGWKQTDVIMQAAPLPNANLTKWMLRGWNILTQACLFRRTFLEKVPVWNETLMNYEDHLYLTLASLHKPSLAHVPQGGVIYRQHGQQSTSSHTRLIHRMQDRVEAFRHIKQNVKEDSLDLLTKTILEARMWEASRSLALTSDAHALFKNKGSHAYQFNRIRNKFERFLTQSAWERMHGIDADPAHFGLLIGQLT